MCPKKGYFRFWSLFVVNFIEMTYKLVSRSETVQIKWKNQKVWYFHFLTPKFRNFQKWIFLLSIFPVKTSETPQKWKIKILISENCNFFEIKKRGGQKPKISYFMIFSHYLDNFWPRNEFIGHFNEIYCKTWWKPISLFFGGHTVHFWAMNINADI